MNDVNVSNTIDVTKQRPQSAEIHPGPGFRITLDIPRPNMNVVEMFSEFSTADISDQLNRLYGVERTIRRVVDADQPLIGPACTVKVFPGDNLMVHKALDIATPGDVIVVDAGGSIKNAVLGDLVSTKARHRGIAGFVVDGYVRDLAAIQALGFPVYARGENMIGPLHRGPGEIVVADSGGVVVVPRDHIAVVHERLVAVRERQASYLANVKRGVFSNAWVDQLLAKEGCEIA
jgi:regulator of RNase E activity RraA